MSVMSGLSGKAKPSAGSGKPLSALATFLAAFAKAPLKVGSPLPSSGAMARHLLAPVDWRAVRTCVELGPGTGSFTRVALGLMRRDASLFAIDQDAHFTDHLRQSIADPRLRAITGSASDLPRLLSTRKVERVDCIISGIPFSALDDEAAGRIVAQSAALLSPSGVFLSYQVRPAIAPLLEGAFREVRASRYWLHVPPCRLYRATGPLGKTDRDAG